MGGEKERDCGSQRHSTKKMIHNLDGENIQTKVNYGENDPQSRWRKYPRSRILFFLVLPFHSVDSVFPIFGHIQYM